MKNLKQASAAKSGWLTVGLLAAVLAVLFWRSFLPDFVHFSNDGPLGAQNAAWLEMPAGITGMVVGFNYPGPSGGAATPNISGILPLVLSPGGFAGFFLA